MASVNTFIQIEIKVTDYLSTQLASADVNAIAADVRRQVRNLVDKDGDTKVTITLAAVASTTTV